MCNLLDELSPLGLHLRKSPSLVDLIQMRLSQTNSSAASCGSTLRAWEVEGRKNWCQHLFLAQLKRWKPQIFLYHFWGLLHGEVRNYVAHVIIVLFVFQFPFHVWCRLERYHMSIMRRQISVTASRHLIDVIDCSWLSHVVWLHHMVNACSNLFPCDNWSEG